MIAALTSLYQRWNGALLPLSIVLATLVASLIVHALLRLLRRRRPDSGDGSAWLTAALDALTAPLLCLVWILGLSALVGELSANGHLPGLEPVFQPTRDVLVIAVVAWFLVRMVARATRTLAQRSAAAGRSFDETAADAINKLVTAAILVIALFIAVQTLGFSVTSLLTFGGVAGIAVGFAAQGLVANMLGGATIYASKPFGVGDHVILPGTQLRGVVQEIGWRATRILGWDGRPFYVPNAKFNTETIINHTRLAYRQLAETILVRLEDVPRIPAIVAAVNAMLEQHPEMRHANRYFIFRLDGYSAQAAQLRLYAYTKSTSYADFMAAKEDILLQIAAIIAAHGAQLAIPPQALYAPHGLGRPVTLPDAVPWPGEPPRPA